MTLPHEVAMPGYIVYRDSPTGQPFDATAPLAFFPPKDSDELFDALRAEFPQLKTHSERMREATIAYLIQERADEQSPATMATPMTAETANTSPWLASFPSMSTDSSNFSSPDMLGLATPSFGNSPQTQHAQPRRASVEVTAAPSTSTPPALEQMTGVFSLSDSTQPKQRIRRKMTEVEKAEYRKRRIVKACDKCSKRKRKCNHNQPEMENLSKASQKVEKSKPLNSHHKKPTAIPMSLSPDPAPDSNDMPQPFVQGEDWFDFTLLDDQMPDMNFDDLLDLDLEKPLENQQYLRNPQSWDDDQSFFDMFKNDLPSQTQYDAELFDHGLTQQQGPLFDHLQSGGAPGFTTGNKKYPVGVQPQPQIRGGVNGNGLPWAYLTSQQHLIDQQPQQAAAFPTLQRTPQTQSAESGDAALFDGPVGDAVGGTGSYSGFSAPRKELTRNLKNLSRHVSQADVLEGDDRHIHQSESTSKNRKDRFNQANEQNRTNVRSVEGSGTKDILQTATRPQSDSSRTAPDGIRAHDSRGNSHNRAADTSTELYMLRNRIPAPTSLHHLRSQTLQVIPRTNGTGDGSDHTRLSTDNYSTPNLTGLSAILPPQPARTRTLASSTSNEGQQSDSSRHAEGSAASATSHSSRPRAHGRSPLREAPTAQSVSAALAASSSNNPLQQHLHDTRRERDHFGRLALATVCVLLFCVATSPPVSLSMVLLALFAQSLDKMSQLGGRARGSVFSAGVFGLAAKGASGWVMTPHSSLRWSVGLDWAGLCG